MDLKEKTVSKNYVYCGKIINVRCDDAELPSGKPCKREVIEHSGGAAVLYVESDAVLLVKQFRYPYGEEIYEIPAGKRNRGEDPAVTAARELAEETGLTATELEHIYTVYPTPGYTDEKIYIYHAKAAVQGSAHPDDGEFLHAQFIPLAEAERMIRDGRIRDGKTIIAVQHYLLYRRA